MPEGERWEMLVDLLPRGLRGPFLTYFRPFWIRTTRLRTNEAVSLPFLRYPPGLPERALTNGPASAQCHLAEQLFSPLKIIPPDSNNEEHPSQKPCWHLVSQWPPRLSKSRIKQFLILHGHCRFPPSLGMSCDQQGAPKKPK